MQPTVHYAAQAIFDGKWKASIHSDHRGQFNMQQKLYAQCPHSQPLQNSDHLGQNRTYKLGSVGQAYDAQSFPDVANEMRK